MDVSINSEALDQLNTDEAKALHKLSDDLSACGVGKIVNLPQIIVVGAQSSGKSSVLEAISHVRFPVEAGVCTRFATELVLRHADKTRVDISVKFADGAKASQAFQRTGFHEDDLSDIIREAKECMGFSQPGRGFSKDVLRLEIEGPTMYPLRLVDLPGLFQTATETQSLEDIKIVDDLVEGYIRQKNSIVLTVITANNQLASHEALRKVKEIDSRGERTIGVITKPDLTHPGYDDERIYVKVAKNQERANKLQLGWHVLRNRAEDEPSLQARDEIENNFFKTGAWASIPREDRGITSLRKKLSRVLYNHIRSSLPGVIEDIEGQLRERQEELSRLGKPRSTLEDMRTFLLRIADKFQQLARDGIYGRYSDPFFGEMDDEEHKLRAQIRNFNRVFDHVLKTKGSAQVIVADEETEPEDDDLPEYLEDLLRRYPYDFPYPEIVTREEVSDQLQWQAAMNQGCEFPGSPNGDLAIQLFKKQTVPWRKIAEFHVNHVTTIAKVFVDELFKHVVEPSHTSRTTEAIWSTCVDPFFNEKKEILQNKLEELLRPYSQGYALPLDVEFHRIMSKTSTDRLASRFYEIMQDKHPELFERDSRAKLTENMITQAISSEEGLQDGEFGTDRVIDSMMAYYEISRRTLTENVINLAIESCLVCDIPYILTPTKVDGMSKERLEELAGESDDTKSRRDSLEQEVKVLREGLAQCRQYRLRTVTALPSSKANVSPTGVTKHSATAASSLTGATRAPPTPAITPEQPATAKSKASSLATSMPQVAAKMSSESSTSGLSSSQAATSKISTPAGFAATKPTGAQSLGSGSKVADSKTPFSSAMPASPAPSTSGGLFGGSLSTVKPTVSTTSAPSIFSTMNPTGSTTGDPSLSSTAKPAGSAAGAPSLFGTPKPASSTASTPSVFSTPTKPASSSGLFTLPNRESSTASAPSLFGAPKPANSTASAAPSLFGAPKPANSPASAPSAFSATTKPASGLFSNTSATSPFGSVAITPQPTIGGFGGGFGGIGSSSSTTDSTNTLGAQHATKSSFGSPRSNNEANSGGFGP